jgi:hypothetical protein
LLIGLAGAWRDLGNQKQYRSTTGGILNWWQSSGTILFQGKPPAAAAFQKAFLSCQVSGTVGLLSNAFG